MPHILSKATHIRIFRNDFGLMKNIFDHFSITAFSCDPRINREGWRKKEEKECPIKGKN